MTRIQDQCEESDLPMKIKEYQKRNCTEREKIEDRDKKARKKGGSPNAAK